MSSWRDRLRPVIAQVIAEVGTDDMKKLRKALREAWPENLGPRSMHPYKIWLDEIRRQLEPRQPHENIAVPKQLPSCKGQMELFQ